MEVNQYDFSGYATKSGLRCSDGRMIMPDAFKDQDGTKVPLLWQHGHSDPSNVLGHVLLENRVDGVYAYCKFNDTDQGRNAKLLVSHGDIVALSIYANHLVEKAKNVIHGAIREVSLVLSGANPGALIDNVMVQHGDGLEEPLLDEAIIYTGLELEHSNPPEEGTKVEKPITHENDEETVADIFESMTDKQREAVAYVLSQALEHSDDDSDEDSDEEAEVEAEAENENESSENDNDDAEHSDDAAGSVNQDNIQHNQEGDLVHNIFENQDKTKVQTAVLSHSDVDSIFKDAKALGSIKEAVTEYALKHGIDNIDTLFPDARAVSSTPEFIQRRTEWVAAVMTGTNHTPFSRIKSLTADITLEEARAKGYIKGNLKKEEFFAVAKRVTLPQTVYKKQKLDRDDILDITDFDVVAWLKAEMRLMLEEEIARAILIGDGRSNADDDKINETMIRPIATDSELYQTTVYVNIDDADSSAEEIIDALTLHRRHYRGSGNPSFFTSETVLSKMLMIKDGMKRRIYSSVADLCVAIRVKEIIAVEVMEDAGDLLGIMVNLQDYTVGADKGGNVAMFDDFDIDYNQYKYLIETRISGALVKPKAAIIVRKVASEAALVRPVAPTFADNEVTVPTTTGVTYKNKATGTTLTTASPVTLDADESLTVIAVPASTSFYFATNADDEWAFDYEVPSA